MKSTSLTLLALIGLLVSGCQSKSPADVTPPSARSAGPSAAASVTSETPASVPSAGGAVGRKDRDPRVFHRSLGEPEFLDPGLCSESEGGTVIHDTFEGLFIYGATQERVEPGVAESVEVSPDGKTYTFKLRAGMKWSDGTPLGAKDFEWSWKRVLDPKTGSRYTDIMAPIEGAMAYARSDEKADRAALREQVGVKAKDDLTLEVKLVGPTPYFKALTAFYTYAPVPRHVVEKLGDQWTRSENVVSNGPWKLSEWKSKQHIFAVKNEHYVGKDSLPFDKVVYHIAENNEPLHNMYLAGEVDFLDSRVPESDLPRYIKEKNPDLRKNPYLGSYYYMFNTKNAPFDDVRVRRALNHAIDKAQIGEFVIKGGQVAATQIVPPDLKAFGYQPPTGPDFDPDAARRLLAEAGFPDGKGFPRFQITYNTLEGHKLIAEFVQQQWKKNLGIDCDLANMEWKVLLKKQQEHDFEVTRSSWIGDFLDPLTFLDLWEGKNPNNRTQWDNPKFNALIGRSRLDGDAQRRLGTLREAEQLFLDDMPALPLYFYVKYDMVKPWLEGYSEHLQGVHLAKYFKIRM